jgi:ATP-binding cassette, subfamily B, bacterial PglK
MNSLIILKKLLNKQERRSLSKVLILVFMMAILDSLGIISIMPFLAVASNYELIETNKYLAIGYEHSLKYGISGYDDFLILLGSLSFLVLLFSSIYRVFTQYQLNKFIELRRHSIGVRLYDAYMFQNYDFFLNKNSSSLSKTILSEVDLVIQQVLRPFIQMIAYSIVVLVLLSLLVFVNPLLSLIIGLVFGGLYILVYLIARNKLKAIGQARLISNEGRFLAVSEGFGGIKAIKLDKSENLFLDKFSNNSYDYSKSQSIAVTINQVPQYVVEALAIGGVILVTIIAIINLGGVRSNAFSEIIPLIGLYVFAAYRFQPALRSVYQGIASIKYGGTALNAVWDIFNNTEDKKISINRKPKDPSKPLHFKNKLTLRKIDYTYPNSEHQAICNISIDIEKNSLVAVMGSSGSGKTTLIDIVLGLLNPNNGNIFLDEHIINDHNISSYQEIIGYVPQDVYLTDSTIYENIAFGTEKDNIDMNKVIKAAKMADLHDFCQQSAHGYKTNVGERGCNLSGGQKQRIGIARALYKEPEILVLDEATSALDSITEKNIISSLLELKNSLTVIFITHKSSIIKPFNKIIYLSEGKVVSEGDYTLLKELQPQIFN